MPKALITGITGQDGSYLTEQLLTKGYEVHGIVRRSSMFNRSRIEHLRGDPEIYGQKLFLHYADLQDATTLRRIFRKVEPQEVYHLAGQSHVGLSFEIPESTCEEVAMATLALLEICRDIGPELRFYHASSSEIFGAPTADEIPQKEETPMRPTSPYGCAKAFATQMTSVYREAYGLFVCSGITYNHESPRRAESFVTRKITAAAARIAAGEQEQLSLGSLDASRDWGYAPEYTDAMWRMLQQDTPRDFILATGRSCTVREFLTASFCAAGIQLTFTGQGAAEIARDAATGKIRVTVDERWYRPVEPTQLLGNPAQARQYLGWTAATQAAALARLMTEADFEGERLKC